MAETYESTYSHSYALIIGINDYHHKGFIPLGDAEDDAQALVDVLSDEPYNFEVIALMGKKATRRAILSALSELQKADRDARILFYFAGHGYVDVDRYGHQTGYLAAVDTDSEDRYTAIRLEEITEFTRHAEAKHVGFIFDSCYSASALGLIAPRDNVAATRYISNRVYQALTAGEDVVDDIRSMTEHIVHLLKAAKVDDDTGLLTMHHIANYVRDRMISQTRSIQKPVLGYLPGSRGGEFVFHSTPEARASTEFDIRLHPQIEDTSEHETPTSDKPLSRPIMIAAAIGAVLLVVTALLLGSRLLSPPTQEEPLPTTAGIAAPPGGGSGLLAFYSDRGDRVDIYLLDLTDFSRLNKTESPSRDWGPDWSPDGQLIAYTSNELGTDNIHILPLDGSPAYVVADTTSNDMLPAWSPDGQRLLFQSDRNGDWDIFSMNPDGSDVRQLTSDPQNDTAASWSPGGQRIAFVRGEDDDKDIFVLNLNTGLEYRLERSPGRDDDPVWSSDAIYIYLSSWRDGNADIYRVEAEDGTNPLQLTDDPADDYLPALSPDGETLAFTSDRDGNWEIYLMDLLTSEVTNVTNNLANDWFPAWQP